ncbi:Protein-N(pi)-phosphohistidine--sugar phosphotransferase [Vibrio scophthalmi]|uniref:Protein-N(Pi)-phosphohistidine--sugar phosphotransferase n=1 Tax=Vibrio scophthalmi TaxID=45658 RepID=A0A1C7FEZ3_9VIBR|nr:Protein-N(pi)-phosphohistidine--sugar phosphotransferase [Vibrio scophthalmi]
MHKPEHSSVFLAIGHLGKTVMDITNLIEPETISLELKAQTKEEVLLELVELLETAGKLDNKNEFLADIWKREKIGNTGFEQGIAIPHAKSYAVSTPAVAVGISRSGIDYGAEDGELSDVFFMLASPDGDDHHHIEVLAQLSSKLIEDGFVDSLKKVETVEQALVLLTDVETEQSPAHYQDRVDLSSVYPSPLKQSLARAKEHLLFGTSHMIPFIVAGGVLLSLSVMISGHGGVPTNGILADIAQMGIAGLTLFTAVLGGYIAYSIADKPGLAPGMIGSWIAVSHYNTGFLGAIVVGFFAGFVVHLLKKNSVAKQYDLARFDLYLSVGRYFCHLRCSDVADWCSNRQCDGVA